MSLFSSPAFRIFNTENSESLVQRKPGANTLIPRKPFVDKTVNCNTPDGHKKQKSNLPIKESCKAPSPTVKTPNLEINPEDYFSYKEVEDQYEDFFLHSERLENHHVYNVLKNYLDDNTPPTSPSMVDIPFEVPIADNSFESSFSSNKSYDDDMFYGLPKKDEFMLNPVEEIDLVEFSIDEM